MNRHALQVVQFPEALAVVASHAASPLGSAAVQALLPAHDPDRIAEELRRVDQMIALRQRAEDWHPGPIPDVTAALRLLVVAGSTLTAPALRDLGTLLRSSRLARSILLRARAPEADLLLQLAERLHAAEQREEALRAAVGEDGELRDTASRELARLRRELRTGRSRIVSRLEQFVAGLPERFQVMDASVSVRDGRYVIPVRREGRNDVGGIVHDESATGSTLFVEPPLAIELMNRLRELELAEAREVQRILRQLTDELRPDQPVLRDSFEALVALDSLYARAGYALHTDGHRPEVRARGDRTYQVVHGRHPLLLAGPGEVVPFDLGFEETERTLLVSGPNTGGKTVLLKAIGLLSALAQAGVVPPVGAGTRLPTFTDMFADIGDEQSIAASLSTFSAHLRNLREVLDHADAESLVLIDEIGSGTDPVEGSALADAVLRELTARGALTVATTHLGQLKLLASEEAAVVNASLQFDAAELRPTYRLLKGIPGRSYGLAIARRLGFPTALLEHAEGSLSGVERDATHLLTELEQKDRDLAAAVSAAESARREAEALRSELKARERVVREREQTAEKRARQQARDLLLHARQEVETAIRSVRDAAASGERAAVEQAAKEARRRIEEQARLQEQRALRAQPTESREPVSVGSWVRIAATGAEGSIVELRDGRAVVEVSGVRVQVSVAGLQATPPPPVRAGRELRGGWSAPELEASSEVDLRGLRVEELIPRLQQAIDGAVQADLQSLRIIHGKGTGAAREAVTELVRSDPRVTSFRPGRVGEGGAGVTIAELQ